MNTQSAIVKVGIIGVSGYSGLTVLERLLKHPRVRVTYVSANQSLGPVDEIWPHLRHRQRLICQSFDLADACEKADLFFLAVPHRVAMTLAPDLLKNGKKVIDLSADYRLKKGSAYNQWYGTPHTDPANLRKAVYGLPEIFRQNIVKSRLVANPGCYPTSALLGLLPMISIHGNLVNSIIIDAKSGVSGAGRKGSVPLSFCEVNESFKAYKVLQHQHQPEIQQYMDHLAEKTIPLEFVPHLIPINRGILSTIYLQLKEKISLKKTAQIYKKFYKTEPFVRVLPEGQQPELKHVTGTNFCNIGLALNRSRNLLVVTSAIDNLVKGAGGQAVQNMNIMCGYEETEGLL